jgi:hypothetical protein
VIQYTYSAYDKTLKMKRCYPSRHKIIYLDVNKERKKQYQFVTLSEYERYSFISSKRGAMICSTISIGMYKSCTKLQQNGWIYHSLTPQKILMSNINLKIVTAEQIHQIQLLKQAEYFTSFPFTCIKVVQNCNKMVGSIPIPQASRILHFINKERNRTIRTDPSKLSIQPSSFL